MGKRLALTVLAAIGFAVAPAQAQIGGPLGWPDGVYEVCDEFNCSVILCEDDVCTIIYTYPRRFEVAPPPL